MDPQVPPPPQPGDRSGGASSSHPAPELPPSTTMAGAEPTISTTTSQPEPCVLGGVHKTASEEDIIMYGKAVHVHGVLSKHQPTHTPVHHDPHGVINYAKAAKEELHEMHEHPRGTGVAAVLLPGAKTGVDMWDKLKPNLKFGFVG